jgi:dihydropteroate synthase
VRDEDLEKSGVGDVLVWPSGRLDFSAGCLVMGILNVTPDSFSDGGLFLDAGQAVEQGLRMASEGAAIIDVGAESTRPGSSQVPAEEQIRRAVPVIRALAGQVRVPISIDTHDVEVARAALDAGAALVNDITALEDDRLASLVCTRQVSIVLMHMKGTPATMQAHPSYQDVVGEVLAFLVERGAKARAFGVARERIFIDPGIGFGKTAEHNLTLLGNLDRLVGTGYRVLVGPSRKRFIGQITGRQEPRERVFGTAAVVALCAAAGVSVVRVHDVGAMVDVVKMVRALKQG